MLIVWAMKANDLYPLIIVDTPANIILLKIKSWHIDIDLVQFRFCFHQDGLYRKPYREVPMKYDDPARSLVTLWSQCRSQFG